MNRYLFLLAAPIMLLAAQPQTNDPAEAMLQMQHEMDAAMVRFHEQMMEAQDSGHFISLNASMPKVDLASEGNRYELSMDIPGASEKSIDIHAKNHIVTVTARREKVLNEKKSKYYEHERLVSSYARSVSVPKDADTAHMKTKYKNGVLTITMPKKA
jgi:HSP20 family molecular chaperone IbpA